MAKLKKTSPYYPNVLNKKGKIVWLSITGFNSDGEKNYRIKIIKSIKYGIPEYKEVWCSPSEISLKHIEDGQLSLVLISEKEKESLKYSPRFFNQRRFEISYYNLKLALNEINYSSPKIFNPKNFDLNILEKQFIQAPDFETAHKIAEQYGFSNFIVRQVPRLTKEELES